MSWNLNVEDSLNVKTCETVGSTSTGKSGLNVYAPQFSVSKTTSNEKLTDLNSFEPEFANVDHYITPGPSSQFGTPSRSFSGSCEDFTNSKGRVETIDEHLESDWSKVSYESPSKQGSHLDLRTPATFKTGSANNLNCPAQSPNNRKQWPSLQIVCPEPAPQPSLVIDLPFLAQETHSHNSVQELSQNHSQYPVGSPTRSSTTGVRAGAPMSTPTRPTSYFPMSGGSVSSSMCDDIPSLGSGMAPYMKMGPTYTPYSPHYGQRGSGMTAATVQAVGFRASPYGMPITPRGSLLSMGGSMSSVVGSTAARSPANRRCVEPIDGYIYQVQFKRAHKNFILAPSAPRNIIPGDFVKVEADRGEDMGIVLSKSPASDFEEVIPTAGYRGRGFSSGQGERKFLFRLANQEERAALVIKVEDEERALEMIRSKVTDRMLPMAILDAEYQFDRHKLTFFFEADRRIDFRELVSELFSLYKTRIWMQQVDTSVLNSHDAGAELAKATGFLPDRDDYEYFQQSQMIRAEVAAQAASANSSFSSNSGSFGGTLMSRTNSFSSACGGYIPLGGGYGNNSASLIGNNFSTEGGAQPFSQSLLLSSSSGEFGGSSGAFSNGGPLLLSPSINNTAASTVIDSTNGTTGSMRSSPQSSFMSPLSGDNSGAFAYSGSSKSLFDGPPSSSSLTSNRALQHRVAAPYQSPSQMPYQRQSSPPLFHNNQQVQYSGRDYGSDSVDAFLEGSWELGHI